MTAGADKGETNRQCYDRRAQEALDLLLDLSNDIKIQREKVRVLGPHNGAWVYAGNMGDFVGALKEIKIAGA